MRRKPYECEHKWEYLDKVFNSPAPKIEDVEYLFYCSKCLELAVTSLKRKKKKGFKEREFDKI